MLTLARISPISIHLKLFGGAHLHWRSLKSCNIAKRTCLNYVWTAMFPWSYCSLKFQVLRLLRARSYKIVEYRLTLKRPNQPSKVFCKKRCSKKFCKIHRKTPVPEPLAEVFSCEFCEISKDAFFTELLLTSAFHPYVTIIIYSGNNEQASIAVFTAVFCFTMEI